MTMRSPRAHTRWRGISGARARPCWTLLCCPPSRRGETWVSEDPEDPGYNWCLMCGGAGEGAAAVAWASTLLHAEWKAGRRAGGGSSAVRLAVASAASAARRMAGSTESCQELSKPGCAHQAAALDPCRVPAAGVGGTDKLVMCTVCKVQGFCSG